METLLQTDQPEVAQDNTPLPQPPLSEEITPLEVVQDFVTAANSDSIARELSDDCVLNFFGHIKRRASPSSYYFRLFIASRFQHEGFEEANFVSTAKAEILKTRFMRDFSWTRRRIIEEQKKNSERATSLHLRAESDDEYEQPLPSRCRPQLLTPPRPGSFGLDEVKFVEANGILKTIDGHSPIEKLDCSTRSAHLTLGYRLLPLTLGNKRHFEICLAFYVKHSVAMPSGLPFPRRGSAVRCNPATDDEAEDDSRLGSGARRTLFADFPSAVKPPSVKEQLFEMEQQFEHLQKQQRLEKQQQQQRLKKQQRLEEQQQQQSLEEQQQQQSLEEQQQQPQIMEQQQQQQRLEQQQQQSPEQQQQQSLQHTPARAEAITTVEGSAEPSAVEEEPPAASISSYTPRKRHIASSEGEVKPKRTPKLNRLRF